MARKWRNYEGIIAKLVPKEHIKGLLKQDVVVRPGETTIIIRNGKIEDSITQTRLEKIGGGLGNWIRKKFDVGEDLELLFVDTTEKDLELPINEISKDHDRVKGTVTIRLKINPSNATHLLGLMKQTPQTDEDKEESYIVPLTKKLWKKKRMLFGGVEDSDWYAGMKLLTSDIEKKLEGELKSKVFEPVIAQHSSSEIRGNPEIREKMENTIATEIRKTFDMWGLSLINFYTTLEAEAYEGLEAHRRKVNLAIENASIDSLPQFADKLRKIERDYQLEKTTMEKAFAKKKMGILNEEDLKDIRQERNVDRQRQLLDFKEKTRLQELDIEWQEHIIDMKEMFGQAYIEKYGVPGVVQIKEKMEEWKRARQQHAVDMRIKEYQGTTLASEKTRAEVEKEKARMEAESAKYDIGAYEKGMDKERDRTHEMMEKSAKMMNAAKQNVPHTYVQSTQPKSEFRMSENTSQNKEDKVGLTCPHCNKNIHLVKQPKYCPFCGEEIKS